MEICGHNMRIFLAKAIKAQVVVEFVVELAPTIESSVGKTWTLDVDVLCGRSGSDAGVVAHRSLNREIVEHAMHLEFPTTKNVTEYEVVLADIRIAAAVKLLMDSCLVAHHIRGEFLSKEESMCKYATVEKKSLSSSHLGK